jgi:tripartite-type tricarboxylate transporter receptor subunit TctC
LAPPLPASAQTAVDFYRGRTIELDISSSVGGGYDVHARLLARHMPKHLPGNPSIVPKNVEGAGGLRMANVFANTAPRDGTVFGILYRATPYEPLFGNRAAQFDPTRFTWIGSAASEVSLCVSSNASPIATFEDLRTHELVVAHAGAGGDAYQFTKVINGVLGTRMRLVGGYPGGNEMLLALERGEVGGRCGWSWSSMQATRPEWIKDGRVNLLVQLALRKHAELPQVPLIVDLAKTDEQRRILRLVFSRQEFAYPFLAPPGVPVDRTAAFRRAFMNTMRDPEFLADAHKAKLEIAPTPGAEIEALVAELYATSPDLVAKTTEMMK